MNPTELENLLRRVESGRLDSLTPEELRAVMTHLESNDAPARRLGAARPPRLPQALLDVPQPSDAAWKRAWGAIDASETSAARSQVIPLPRRSLTRHARPAIAAMAAFFAIGSSILFRTTTQAVASDELVLDPNATIDEIEVPEGCSSFVMTGDGESDFSIVRIVEDDG